MTAGAYVLAAVFTAYRDYAMTPQRAALQILGPRARVVRTNLAGRYATVVTKNGIVERDVLREAILLKRFSFGWQPLSIVDRCSLSEQRIAERDKVQLMRGIPKPPVYRPCVNGLRDFGPRTGVESVRKQLRGPLVPAAIVDGRFALARWYGLGGGETLFRFDRGRWHQIAGGGGVMGEETMRENGVPKHAWRTFGISGTAR